MERVSIYCDLYNFLDTSYTFLKQRAFIDFTKFHYHFIDSNKQKLISVSIFGGSNLEGLLYKLSHYNHINIIQNSIGWDSKEKRTDVNIAVAMLVDAFNDKYDTAILMSGGADFISLVNEVRNMNKKVVIATPDGQSKANAIKLINSADEVKVLNNDFYKKYSLQPNKWGSMR